jgi:hypothetical protein
MKDFKQTTKMKAEGSHYCGGGKVKKYADGGDVTEGQNANIGSDVRSRALAAMAQRDQDIGGGGDQPVVVAKKVVKKTATKLPMPDYSNEDLDRIDAQIAEKTRRNKRTPGQMVKEESEYAIKPPLQVKGEELMKNFGMKHGGKVKRGAKK